MNYKLLFLPLCFAIIGFLVTTKSFLKFYNSLGPAKGLAFYYVIISCTIIILEYLGLIIADIHFNSFNHFLGTVFLNFSFFLIVIWSNCYVAEITKGGCKNFTEIYLNSESGATYYLWSKVTNNQKLKRFLTFVITPFILAIIGIFLIKQK